MEYPLLWESFVRKVFSWFHRWGGMCHRLSWYELSQFVKCTHVQGRRRYRLRFRRLQCLWAAVLIMPFWCRFYYSHCCQNDKWVARQFQVVEAWWNKWELPSKSIWLCRFVWIGVDCDKLWCGRCNRWYWYHLSVFIAWHFCGIQNNRRAWFGKLGSLDDCSTKKTSDSIESIEVLEVIFKIETLNLKLQKQNFRKNLCVAATEWNKLKSKSD